MMPSVVWVFCGNNASCPSGVFTDPKIATSWIAKHGLSGVLTQYPLDIGLYEWAVSKGHFRPDRPWQQKPSFIASFTSACLEHHHFEEGQRRA